MRSNIVAVILAGGKGSRLEPLTRDRAKPAVPFGGGYRIIDFTLSNCFNSGLRRILVLTQYKSSSLARHLSMGWSRFFCRELGEFLDLLPPQQRIDDRWYHGTADAVYQNIYSIEKVEPEYILILAGDHIYQMDYEKLFQFHCMKDADVTIAALPVSCREARRQFGVMETDLENRIVGFEEKPDEPKSLPNNPETCLASMGIYLFRARFLFEQLCQDAILRSSGRDFGKDIIPRIIEKNRVFAWPFTDQQTGAPAYWRDVGTLDAYYEANMDLVSIEPTLNIYDRNWPTFTHQPYLPPPKFILSENERSGLAMDSIICSGSIISGGTVRHSLVGHSVRVESFATVEDSILFSGASIGRKCYIRRAVVEKNVAIPDRWTIGVDRQMDRQRGFHVTESGLTIVPREWRPDNFTIG